MARIELATPSLPRKYSTTELHWRFDKKIPSVLSKALSGRRDSNSRPSAWKADALPTELLPQLLVCGESRIRTYEDISQQIYSLPQLAALVSPLYKLQLRLIAVQAKCLQFRMANVRIIYFTTNTYCCFILFFRKANKL